MRGNEDMLSLPKAASHYARSTVREDGLIKCSFELCLVGFGFRLRFKIHLKVFERPPGYRTYFNIFQGFNGSISRHPLMLLLAPEALAKYCTYFFKECAESQSVRASVRAALFLFYRVCFH